MTRKTDKYANFVEHPRYGRGPRITGLNPRPFDSGVHLHHAAIAPAELAAFYASVMGRPFPFNADYPDRPRRIANTAVVADLARQTPATVPVTHYLDLERPCRACRRWFIFFAEEQKYWYEELGFGLDSDCVRCVECRKLQQGIARQRETYERLFHVADKSAEQLLEMAEACLALIEAGIFTSRQYQRVRALLNAVPAEDDARKRARHRHLLGRAQAAESAGDL